MSIKQITKLRYKTKDKPPMEGVPLLGYNKRYDCPWIVVYRSKDKYYTCMKYDKVADFKETVKQYFSKKAGAMISLAIELITSNIRRNYGEINFERYPRPVEVEGEDKH